MKLQRLLPLAILATTSVFAAPPSFFDGAQQVVLGGAETKFKGIANQYLSEAKQAILKGKKELETWYHDGKEFIKQNNLLCEFVIGSCVVLVILLFTWERRRACTTPRVLQLFAEGYRAQAVRPVCETTIRILGRCG
jgi:hypothetical protein